MKIGIEAQRLFREKKHGLEIVAMEMIRHLQAIDKINQYVIFVRKDVDNICIEETSNFRILEIPASSFPEWEQIKLPAAIKKEKIDILHCTANTAPLFSSVPIILTLHDVIFLEDTAILDNYYQNLGNIYRKLVVRMTVKKVKRVLTVSHSEKKQILKHFNLNSNKLKVLYNAADKSFKKMSIAETERIKLKYSLPDNFILFFGNSAAKKNTEGTINGYLHYLNKGNDQKLPLVVAGAFEEYLRNMLAKYNLQPKVQAKIKIIGYIPFSDQPALYNLADLFLYTSKRESFGLPILESMACGTPVISSNTSSIPEIADTAAHLIDPSNPVSIGDGILKVLGDEAYRNQLVDLGYKRASDFSWETNAQELVKIYGEVFQETEMAKK